MKNKKRNIDQYLEKDKKIFKISNRIQHHFPVQKITEDGIFVLQDGYSKTYRFGDLNYFISSDEEQKNILETYCKVLNGINNRLTFTYINKKIDHKELQKKLIYQEENLIQRARNKVVVDKVLHNLEEIETSKYLTITNKNVDTLDKVRSRFISDEEHLKSRFQELDSNIESLTIKERLKVLQEILNPNHVFDFDYEAYKTRSRDFTTCFSAYQIKEDINGYLIQTSKNKKEYIRCLYVKDFSSAVEDKFIKELMNLPYEIIVSYTIEAIPKNISVATLNKIYENIQDKKVRKHMERKAKGDQLIELPYHLQQEESNVLKIRSSIAENNENLFLIGVSICFKADSLEQLEKIQNEIESRCESYSYTVAVDQYSQLENYFSTLPFGARYIKHMRTMLTTEIALQHPFNAQEIQEDKGFFYGINDNTKKYVLANRKLLANANGMIFGVSGSGKSMAAKWEMLEALQNTDADVLVVDPQHEFNKLIDSFDGEFFEISPKSKTYFNPFDYNLPGISNLENERKELMIEKSQLLMAIVENSIKRELSTTEMNIIDVAIKNLYIHHFQNLDQGYNTIPILSDFLSEIQASQLEEAEELTKAFDIFVNGSLNLFNNHTNININKRFVVYGIRDLGRYLSGIGILVLLQNIEDRIMHNWRKGINTYVYFDEIAILTKYSGTSEYLSVWWKKVRKFGAICTGMTQDISDVDTEEALAMISNSEFVIYLRQSPKHHERLLELGLNETELKYLYKAAKGHGIMRYGNKKVYFDLEIPKNNIIFELLQTDAYINQE